MNTTNNLTTFANEINKVLVGLDLASKEIQLSLANSEGIEHDFKLTPKKFFKYITKHANQNHVFAMEACGGSNYWATLIQRLGAEVYIFPAKSCQIITAARTRMIREMPVVSEMRC